MSFRWSWGPQDPSARRNKRSSTSSVPPTPTVPSQILSCQLRAPRQYSRRNTDGSFFPETPLLFAAPDQRYLRGAPLGENETAVASANDFPGLVDEILQLLPETKRVFMVMGSGQIGRFWHQELTAPLERFHDRLTFEWSDDLSLAEVLSRCASLPDHTAILYLMFGTDGAGAAYADERVVADLHATANAPLFAAMSVYLGLRHSRRPVAVY